LLEETGGAGREAGVDALAHPSAHALGALCALLDTHYYRLGYLLGRWVYLMDAADDIEGDRKHGRFNAFEKYGRGPGGLIRATSAELRRAWDRTETRRFRPILDNILTLGLPDMERRVLKEGEADEKSV
jgi:hypothetical protein